LAAPPEVELRSAVTVLISAVVAAASVAIMLTLPATVEVAREHPVELLAFLALTIALQLLSVEIYGVGAEGVSAMGMLAAAFALGPGPAMCIAVVAALTQWLRNRGLFHRALFDAADFALATGAAAVVFQLAGGLGASPVALGALALLAGLVFKALNTGLLCLAMSVAESLPVRTVWRERFRWARLHYLMFGPVALVTAVAFQEMGLLGLVAFSVPPALMMVSVREYLQHTRASVAEVKRANDELLAANEELERRHADMKELFELAGGLAAHAHDRDALVAYAERGLSTLTGTRTRISLELDEGEIALVAAGTPVGGISFQRSLDFDRDRWARLRDALLPQLSTALQSAGLVEQLRTTHRATIAALSRSMEAKDLYTGGHTERVATIARALGRRLGFASADLDAVEIGALLHDIGKIGIPEHVLNKPGPLDEDEWELMREHPIISEYILADVDLPEIVRQIARSSHERIDGTGYPDGLRGDRIPLAARIVLVADAFDAITSDRPYRRSRSVAAAITELRTNAGTQFCPRVVAALEAIHREDPALLGEPVLRAVEAGAA
jgi:putative nucleotidyltransferase with HDIG domain